MNEETHQKLMTIKRSFRLLMNGPGSQSMRDKGLGYKLNWGVPFYELKKMAQEYGKDYDLNNLLTLLSRYTNAAAFVKDPELKKAMFDRGMEVFKAIDEKADKTSNYAVVLQRKASLMNGYYGANVNEECAKTYQEALDAMAKDANMSEQLKNSIAYEANLYIATYAQVAENNMAKAKEHYEKAYTAKPNDQLRKFIDAQFK